MPDKVRFSQEHRTSRGKEFRFSPRKNPHFDGAEKLKGQMRMLWFALEKLMQLTDPEKEANLELEGNLILFKDVNKAIPARLEQLFYNIPGMQWSDKHECWAFEIYQHP